MIEQRANTPGIGHIKTIQGKPVSVLGLAGSPQLDDLDCVAMAFDTGINFFFFYNLSYATLLDGLVPLLSTQRQDLIIATGSQHRDINALRQYLDQVRSRLDIEAVDAFFLEYISPTDEMEEVRLALDTLQRWQQQGLIRYVGATTHSRSIATHLIAEGQCDVLMHRYNMAHRKAEERVLPAAHQAGLPVIAFTCTRWGALLGGHPDWSFETPQATDCYRFVLQHPAVHLALTAPQTRAQLLENLSVLSASDVSAETLQCWQDYGDLVYGMGKDAFETRWP